MPEVLFPHPKFPPTPVTSKGENDFWEKTNLDEVGTDAYIKYIGVKAYEIGARIVRKYLSTHNVSIIEAHNLSNEELYWNSGYPLLR
ncbi:hypothetical protein J2TS4_32720 [Paenibacillus sp. J2TS4]|nr:hypothetical protein J2TS4_32720 [Paenibacillus sp. J2TS4]